VAILRPAVTRDGDQDDRLGQLLPELGSHLIAVQAGQADIQQHISRLRAAGNLDRLISVAGGLDVVAEVSQQASNGLGRIPVVVHDEDSGGIDAMTQERHYPLTYPSRANGRGLTMGVNGSGGVAVPGDVERPHRVSSDAPAAPSSSVLCSAAMLRR